MEADEPGRQAEGPPADSAATPPGLIGNPMMLLALVGRAAQEAVDARLVELGLSMRLIGVLGHLRRTPALSYSELARRAGVTVQSMAATVAQLEDAGYVAPSSPTGRGRAAQLLLTPAGETLLGQAETALAELEGDWLPLSEAQRRELTSILARVGRNVIQPPSQRADRPPNRLT